MVQQTKFVAIKRKHALATVANQENFIAQAQTRAKHKPMSETHLLKYTAYMTFPS